MCSWRFYTRKLFGHRVMLLYYKESGRDCLGDHSWCPVRSQKWCNLERRRHKVKCREFSFSLKWHAGYKYPWPVLGETRGNVTVKYFDFPHTSSFTDVFIINTDVRWNSGLREAHGCPSGESKCFQCVLSFHMFSILLSEKKRKKTLHTHMQS